MKQKENRKIKVGRYSIELTNESKILFPKDGITKGDLIAYYQEIAPHMLPWLKNRPLTMQRYPAGIKDEGFYQKDASDYFPAWIKTVAVARESGGKVHYVICNNAATLVYLANQGCITPHLWLSKADKLDYPDRIIFDLDPSGKDFTLVRKTALQLKELLESLGMYPYVMTTGSRGLHVVIPIKRTAPFDEVRQFARDIASYVMDQNPKTLTIEMRKEKRKGRLLIDYFRNAFGQMGVAPYAVRPLNGAPVATPISWKEVASSALTSQKYTLRTVGKRLARMQDPWHDFDAHAVGLKGARKKLDRLIKGK